MAKYEELEKGTFLTDSAKREQVSKQVTREDEAYYKHAIPALNRSKGAGEAMRKYERAKRDYEKAGIFGKAFLKLTGQANFKKMLKDANNRSR